LTGTRAALILGYISGILPAAAWAQTRPEAPAASPRREALDRELQQILAAPDFQRAMRGGDEDSLNPAEWLRLQVRRLLERLGGLHQTNYALFLVSVSVLVAVLLALLAHITYTLVRALRRPSGERSGPARPAPSPPQSPEDLRRQADELAARGEFREAVRALYLALLRSLQLKGVLPRTRSQTNAENLRALRGCLTLLASVQPFTETYDSRWYGRRPAGPEDVARCREWLEAALREVADL
jgi:hypothetical protein